MTADVAPGASHTDIVIVIDLGANAEEYTARLEETRPLRPARCPGCAGQHIVGHGGYERWAVYVDRDVRVWIRRWKCAGCGKTISLLPSFLHRHRHYALAVIEAVLRGRLEQGAPWSSLTPSQRSLRRWMAAFVAQALNWLTALLKALARVLPLLGVLGPHGAADRPAASVLALGATFAGWLDPASAARPGGALRVMWQWGWNAGIGRLI